MSDRQGPSVGQRLRDARLSRGLKQSELAERIGKPQSSISAYEADETSPSVEVLCAIAKALDCRPGVFLDDFSSSALEARLRELDYMILTLPPQDYEDLLETIQILAAVRLARLKRQQDGVVTLTH